MRLRRRHPLAEPVALAARQLKLLESRIALLDRVRPLDLPNEQARLLSAWLAGSTPAPLFTYAPGAGHGSLQAELDEVSRALPLGAFESQLLLERAAELRLEAELAASLDSPAFRGLAARRFPLPQAREQTHQAAVACLSAALEPEVASELHVSDDRRDPLSLWSLLVAHLERERLAVRVEVVPGLVALAAVADGVVRLRAGARLTADVARRIAIHEVDGHVRPRLAGQLLGGVFWAGSAGASEDEEGRALLLEERAGLLGGARRRELGLRYLAAESVRDGADFRQTVRLLVEHGAASEAAIELACRVHRGGGLGRELVYLTGFQRAKAAFSQRPELESVASSGRLSISAASQLLDAGSIELDDDRNMV